MADQIFSGPFSYKGNPGSWRGGTEEDIVARQQQGVGARPEDLKAIGAATDNYVRGITNNKNAINLIRDGHERLTGTLNRQKVATEQVIRTEEKLTQARQASIRSMGGGGTGGRPPIPPVAGGGGFVPGQPDPRDTGRLAKALTNRGVDIRNPVGSLSALAIGNPYFTAAASAIGVGIHGMNVPFLNMSIPGYLDMLKTGQQTGEGAGAGASAFGQALQLGGNPFDQISNQVAQSIVAGIRGKGFRGAIANALGTSIVDIVKDTGLEWSTLLEDATYFLRQTNTSLSDFTGIMKGLDDVAKETGFSVEETRQGVVDLAKTLSGLTPGQNIVGAAQIQSTLAEAFKIPGAEASSLLTGDRLTTLGYMAGILPEEIGTASGQEKIQGMVGDFVRTAQTQFPEWWKANHPDLSREEALGAFASRISQYGAGGGMGGVAFQGADPATILKLLQGDASALSAPAIQEARGEKAFDLAEGAYEGVMNKDKQPWWKEGIPGLDDNWFDNLIGRDKDLGPAQEAYINRLKESGFVPEEIINYLSEHATGGRGFDAKVEWYRALEKVEAMRTGSSVTGDGSEAMLQMPTGYITIGVDPKNNQIKVTDAKLASNNWDVNRGAQRSNQTNSRGTVLSTGGYVNGG